MTRTTPSIVLALALACVGCTATTNFNGYTYGDGGSQRDGAADGAAGDAHVQDASSPDAGRTDGGRTDAGRVDAGGVDAGGVDAGGVDAGGADAGGADAGRADAGPPDAGPPDCGALTDPAHGAVSAASTTGGAMASYTCDTGYTLVGAAMRTCQADGTWSGAAPTCMLVDCGALTAPSHGTVSEPSTTYGGSASYACDMGYTLGGMAMRTCQADGTWSGAAPTCTPVDCGSLSNPTHGAISAGSTTYGAMATYTCSSGYTVSGASMRTCQASGTWSGTAPTCAPVDCGSLSNPTHGAVSAASTTYGAMATYTCSSGYTVSGASMRTCQASGTWSGTAPTCAPVSCGALTAPANGTVSTTGTTYGGTATYACNMGYVVSGAAMRTCQASGTWSGTAPTCMPHCPAPPSVANGTVSAPSGNPGALATYSCNAGYRLAGGNYLGCGPTGTWIGQPPVCQALASCVCGGAFAIGEQVTAAAANPSGSTGLAAGTVGTVLGGNPGTPPMLVQWSGWTSGHSGNCSLLTCGSCTDSGSSRWYVACADVTTQRLTCACGGVFSQGDRVVLLVNSPDGASGLSQGATGTVISGGTGTPPLLVQWDGWTSGHNGNCSASTCGSCTPSGSSRWYVNCNEIARAP